MEMVLRADAPAAEYPEMLTFGSVLRACRTPPDGLTSSKMSFDTDLRRLEFLLRCQHTRIEPRSLQDPPNACVGEASTRAKVQAGRIALNPGISTSKARWISQPVASAMMISEPHLSTPSR